MIEGGLNEFYGKKVKDFNSNLELSSEFAYKIRTDWDDEEGFITKLKDFFSKPNISEVEALVIGLWAPECESDSTELVSLLIENKDKLPVLKALMIGDIEGEEQEISWIEQSELGGLLSSFQSLEEFRVRGGQDLRISNINHPTLKKLVIETGGISEVVLNDVATAVLPNLEHLELWLGEENYGFDAGVEDIKKVLTSFENHKLNYLGLRNSEIADELPSLVLNSKLVDQVSTLDFSKGVMSDKGAAVLLESPKILKLKKLILQHHYIGDELMHKLGDLPIDVDISDQQEDDDYDGEVWRYIAVGE